MSIPLIQMSGDPYQRSLTYGAFAQIQIMKVVEEYKYLFEKKDQLNWEMAQVKAMNFNKVVQDFCPERALEMQGVAKRAKVDYSAIFTINCRTEIIFSKTLKVLQP